ncbi:MAG: hypothetical protein D4R44_04670, partial [Actinobacteria bacterium]
MSIAVMSIVMLCTLLPFSPVVTPVHAAAFNSGAGRSWTISAAAVGGGAIEAGGQMVVTTTLTWDAVMYDYLYLNGSSCTTKGSTSTLRASDLYFMSTSANPSSYLYGNCTTTDRALSDNFLTSTLSRTITAPTTAGTYSVQSYGRGATFFNDSTNYSYSTAFSYTVVDTTAPTVSSFSSTTSNGSYKAAATINITATMSESVTTPASITVTLDTGATVVLTHASATTSLTGTYTVGAGQTSSDLTVSSYALTSAPIDSAGNVMTSTTVPTGASNIAGANAIIIDTTAPTVTLAA